MLSDGRTALEHEPHRHDEETQPPDGRADDGQDVGLDPGKPVTDLFPLPRRWRHPPPTFSGDGLHLVEQVTPVVALFAPPLEFRIGREDPVS